MKNLLVKSIFNILYMLLLPLILMQLLFVKKHRDTLIWGTSPIISNKYWSEALQRYGYKSVTLMRSLYSINSKKDFDFYFDDLVPKFIKGEMIRKGISPYFAFNFIIKNAGVVHLPYGAGPLGLTPIWRIEAWLYHKAGIKIIIMPYGSDAYMYSHVIDKSLLNALLLSYPTMSSKEDSIRERVKYWTKNADIIISGFIGSDGFGRWDVTLPQTCMIDTDLWTPTYKSNTGCDNLIKILHTPNHRGFKGSEFIINAVEELRDEGYKVELVLIENKSNEEVRILMKEAHILVEQLIFTGYALSGLEGMASGLPVLSNLQNENYTRLYRRYSYLNECPILSTTPENVKENLRILITNPDLRMELGQAGRLYVEKYHSYETAQYLFGSIYKKILDGEDIDLMNLFHPLKSAYNKSKPLIKHPLVENKLPDEYLKKAASEKQQ